MKKDSQENKTPGSSKDEHEDLHSEAPNEITSPEKEGDDTSLDASSDDSSEDEKVLSQRLENLDLFLDDPVGRESLSETQQKGTDTLDTTFQKDGSSDDKETLSPQIEIEKEAPPEILEKLREMDLDEEQLTAIDEVRKEIIKDSGTSTRKGIRKIEPSDITPVDIDEYEEEGDRVPRITKRTLLWVLLFVLLTVLVILLRIQITDILNPSQTPDISSSMLVDSAEDPDIGEIYPVRLQFLGGWHFTLGIGDIVDGIWEPQSAEWLRGTELRRIVAIPWSKQLEVVVDSMESGLEIELIMSNDDILEYKLVEVVKVSRSQVDAISGNIPALVIIVFNPESDDRLILTCIP